MKKSLIPQKKKDFIVRSCRKHAWNMGVSEYLIDIFYSEKDLEEEKGFDTCADITVDTRYKKALFRIYPNAFKKWDERGDKWMDSIIAHEIAHILVRQFAFVAEARWCTDSEFNDAHETLTEMIGRMSARISSPE